MRSYRYLHFDVFTRHLFGGNQLAVFTDGRGLSPMVMQAIAKEMNFSESTFVLPAEESGTDLRVRIFTPAEELPMAGHPTIGTAFALSRSGVLAPGLPSATFGLGVGPTHVDLDWRGDELAFAWMTQLVPTIGPAITNRGAVAAALRLHLTDMTPGLPVQVISCGVPYLLVPLRTRQAVDAASLDGHAYDSFTREAGLADHLCVYPFTTEGGEDGAATYARMFGPGVGIVEDPATGSAAGPLGCYLVLNRLVPEERLAGMVIRQGVKMGRPSDIHVAIQAEGGDITSVRVGGEAVLAGEGTLYV